MPESFYPLAISCVFRENTFCVRNWAMIGRIPPLLSTTWIWDGCPAIQFVADSQNPMGSKCQGTRFEISWYRTSCRKNLLPTKNQPSGWRMLETTRSDHMPGIAWSYVRRVQMFFARAVKLRAMLNRSPEQVMRTHACRFPCQCRSFSSFPVPQGRVPHLDYWSNAASLRRHACPFLWTSAHTFPIHPAWERIHPLTWNTTPHILGAQGNPAFRGIKQFVWKPRFLWLTFIGFHPFLVARPRSQEQVPGSLLCRGYGSPKWGRTLFGSCFSPLLLSLLCRQEVHQSGFWSDSGLQAWVKPDHRILVAPFIYFLLLRFLEQVHVLWHELCSYLGPDVFSVSLQLFHELQLGLFHRCGLALFQGCHPRSPKLAHACFLSWAWTSAPSDGFFSIRFEILDNFLFRSAAVLPLFFQLCMPMPQ